MQNQPYKINMYIMGKILDTCELSSEIYLESLRQKELLAEIFKRKGIYPIIGIFSQDDCSEDGLENVLHIKIRLREDGFYKLKIKETKTLLVTPSLNTAAKTCISESLCYFETQKKIKSKINSDLTY